MSRLTIYRDDAPLVAELDTEDETQIRDALAGIEVRFERWAASAPLTSADQDDDILAAYRSEIARLERAHALDPNGAPSVQMLAATRQAAGQS